MFSDLTKKQTYCRLGTQQQFKGFPLDLAALHRKLTTTYHDWNLIGRRGQVGGGAYSAALLDSFAFAAVGGGVCSH